jgi:predicted membrane GTPase involved in stress response
MVNRHPLSGLRIQVPLATAGDIAPIAGVDKVNIGDTLSSPEDPRHYL